MIDKKYDYGYSQTGEIDGVSINQAELNININHLSKEERVDFINSIQKWLNEVLVDTIKNKS